MACGIPVVKNTKPLKQSRMLWQRNFFLKAFPHGTLHVHARPALIIPQAPDGSKQSGRCSDCAHGYDGVGEELLRYSFVEKLGPDTSNRARTRVMCVQVTPRL